MRQYRCEICDCRLDPGEGSICEECQEEREHRRQKMLSRQQAAMRERKDGQLELAI